MARTHDALDEGLERFIGRQHVFFVATAPAGGEGHVNVSPKGLDTFRVLGPTTVAYLDLTGSGVETIAHLRENGRITLMFCAFEGAPRIVRLFGRGRAVEVGTEEFERLAGRFPPLPGARAVVCVELDRIADSCGYGVPLLRYEGGRDRLLEWAEMKGPDGVAEYRATRNRESIDGLEGFGA